MESSRFYVTQGRVRSGQRRFAEHFPADKITCVVCQGKERKRGSERKIRRDKRERERETEKEREIKIVRERERERDKDSNREGEREGCREGAE